MKNTILGMRTLNVTQGNYAWIPSKNYFSDNASHMGFNALDLGGEDTGQDVWRAKNRWKVTRILLKSNTGFNNTIFFSPCDEQGRLELINTPSGIKKLTLALTHIDFKNIKVKENQIVEGDFFMYMEGQTGDVPNHVHAEVCFEFIDYKVNLKGKEYFNGSAWVLPNAVPLHEALFLLKDYNVIKQSGGYDWKWVDSINYEGGNEMPNFLTGYQVLNFAGQEIHVYKQGEGLDIGAMSAKGNPDYMALQDIKNIDDDRVHYCKVNMNYFQMGGPENGQHYGVEFTPTMSLAPKQKQWLALWIDKQDRIGYTTADNFWESKSSVKLACSPAAIMLHDGKDVEIYSEASGKGKITTANTQTLLLQFSDKSFAFAVVKGNLNGYQCRDFAKAYGATHMSMYDSGGSSQMVVAGAYKVHTTRAIPNVFTFYKKAGVPNPEPTPDPKPEDDKDKKIAELSKQVDNLVKETSELKKALDSANTQLSEANKLNATLSGKIEKAKVALN